MMRSDQLPKPFAPAESMPCPFCGSEDISDGEVLIEIDGDTFTQSECQSCGALGPRAFVNGPDYGDVAAIAAWNRRSQTDGGRE